MEEHEIDITGITDHVVNNITYVGYIKNELDLLAETKANSCRRRSS